MGSTVPASLSILQKVIDVFFFKEIFIYLFLAGLGLHCCIQFSSGCGEGELLSSCGARASPCSGFSCCRAVALLDFSSCST